VLVINNQLVKRVSSTKFLGLFIDDMLSWSSHVNMLKLKLSKAVGLIRVASYCMPRNVLLNSYHAFFYSHILYDLLIWGNACTTYLQPIRLLQKKCIRIVAGANWREPTKPLAFDLGILMLDDLYLYKVSMLMFKVYHNLLSDCIIQMFTRTDTVHQQTRASDYDFFIPRVRLDVVKKFVVFTGPWNWSKLSIELKTIASFSAFKWSLFIELSSAYVNSVL